ncbi:MAG TPA: hypothetical protein ENJ53_04255, partial [Phaeodactylibacter sp.]|nr:hypothetical protein [Phaeodactylibacter sp.]
KLKLIILSLFIFGLFAPVFSQNLQTYFQENDLHPESSSKNFFFTIENKGKGRKAKTGDYVKIRYKGMLLDGTVFDQTEENDPFVFRLGHRQVIKGWDEGLQEFRAGGNGTLFLPAEMAYGKMGISDVIPSNSDLIYEIELLEIMDSKQYNQYMKQQELKAKKEFEAKKKAQFAADKKAIQQYASKNKMKIKRLPCGVSYLLKKKGKGKTIQAGDHLKVHYEGRLLDGTLFDSSLDGEPFEFVFGKGKTIEGWEEGLKKFKRGSVGWLLIPSKLAYGPRPIHEGKINIPANSVLIFKIKIVDVD